MREKEYLHDLAFIPHGSDSESVVTADHYPLQSCAINKKIMTVGDDSLIEIKVNQEASEKINIVLDASDLADDNVRFDKAVKRVEHYNKAKLKNRFAVVLIDKLTSEVAALKEEVEYLREDSKQKSQVIKSLAQKVLEKTESHDKWHFKVVKQVEQNTQHPIPEVETPADVGCCGALAMCLVDSMEEPEVSLYKY